MISQERFTQLSELPLNEMLIRLDPQKQFNESKSCTVSIGKQYRDLYSAYSKLVAGAIFGQKRLLINDAIIKASEYAMDLDLGVKSVRESVEAYLVINSYSTFENFLAGTVIVDSDDLKAHKPELFWTDDETLNLDLIPSVKEFTIDDIPKVLEKTFPFKPDNTYFLVQKVEADQCTQYFFYLYLAPQYLV